jgi:hypothetical protein
MNWFARRLPLALSLDLYEKITSFLCYTPVVCTTVHVASFCPLGRAPFREGEPPLVGLHENREGRRKNFIYIYVVREEEEETQKLTCLAFTILVAS